MTKSSMKRNEITTAAFITDHSKASYTINLFFLIRTMHKLKFSMAFYTGILIIAFANAIACIVFSSFFLYQERIDKILMSQCLNCIMYLKKFYSNFFV